jgi:hypothetical protein
LPATLLKEAVDGDAARVLNIAVTVGDLYPLELKDSRDIGVDCALSKQGPFYGRGGRPCPLSRELEGRRGHIALAVVRE